MPENDPPSAKSRLPRVVVSVTSPDISDEEQFASEGIAALAVICVEEDTSPKGASGYKLDVFGLGSNEHLIHMGTTVLGILQHRGLLTACMREMMTSPNEIFSEETRTIDFNPKETS